MGHPLLSVLGLSIALVVAEGLRHASTPVAALVLVLVVTVAAIISSRVGPVAVAAGAMAAVAWVVLRPVAAPLAGAAFVVLLLLGRTLRVLSAPAKALHVGLGIAGGGVAAWSSSRWMPDALPFLHPSSAGATQLAAMLLTMLAVGLPFLIEAERPETHALLSLVRRSRGPARQRLLRAVAIARRSDGLVTLEASERRALRRALSDLSAVVERLMDGGAKGASVAAAVAPRLAALGRAVRALGQVETAEHALEARALSETDLTERAQVRRAVLASLDEPAPAPVAADDLRGTGPC